MIYTIQIFIIISEQRIPLFCWLLSLQYRDIFIIDEMIRDEPAEEKQAVQNAPKETLYIRNLNEKMKPKDIKYALYNLFEAYGEILQIVAKRNNKMRGQAFIVFKEVGQATAAKNNLSGYPIFGKSMQITFAEKRSKIVTFNR